MENLIEVVGTMFFRNGKLLIDKPRKKPTFQMIGGKVEEGETTREAAIRECHEELGKNGIEFAKQFSPEIIIQQWHKLFIKVYNDEKLEYIKPNNFMSSNFKWLRVLNRKTKKILRIEYPISIIGLETLVRNMLRMIKND